ncbi:MAG: WD40 repeat domain-containing protein, partial [Gemmataceae bacterium]
MATGKELRRYPTGMWNVWKIAFSRDGKHLALRSTSGAIQLWDTATGRVLPASVDPVLEGISDVRFSSDGRRLLGQTDRYIAWDPATGREIRRTAKPPGSPRLLALSPDESLLAGADSDDPKGTIRLWAAATGQLERALNGHQDKVHSFVFSPDSRRLASTDYNKTIRVWDVANGRQLHQFNVKDTEFLTFSPDGRWLASANYLGDPTRDGQIILWDLVSGREKSRFAPVRNKSVYRLAFSPDSRLLAATVGGNGRNDPIEVAVWDVANGTRLHLLDGQKTGAWSLAFSPDGRMLAIEGSDGALILWELASDRKRHQFIGHENGIGSLAFSPDGRYLAAASPEAPAFVWDVFGVVAAKQRRLSNDELQRCWAVLAGNDAAAAFQSIRRLAAAPEQTLPLLRQHLKPVPAPDNKSVRRLVEMLDSDDFPTRQKAAEELEKQADAGLLRQIVAKEKP